MCTNSQSDLDNATFADIRHKPSKPVPGSVPSRRRITAQNLIKKHRASISLKTELPDSAKPATIIDNPILPPNLNKTEPTPNSDIPKKRVIKTKPKVNSKRHNISPKPKPSLKAEPKLESPKLTLSKKGKSGEWHIKEFARIKHKKERKHNCPAVCNYTCNSTKLLNEHYRNSHPPIICKTCTKSFNNPSSYRRPSYWHKKSASSDMFHCNRCDYSCPFKSTLESHKDKHRRGYFFCFSAGCWKSFQCDSSLKAHVKLHNGKDIFCDRCDYVCKDVRYLAQHYRSHTKELKFYCHECNKGFSFYQQLKRHRCCTNT